jgi:putative two-component system response regulator
MSIPFNDREIVLIVDDDETIRGLLHAKLSKEGFNCLGASGSMEAMDAIQSRRVALVLLDINLPGKSGLQILPEIKAESPDTVVIMITGSTDINTVIQYIRHGAYDYLTKPFSLESVVLSVRRALEKRGLELENREFQATLERRVAQKSKESAQALAKIKSASMDTIVRLSRAAESRDGDPGDHILRLSRYAAIIAERFGLPGAEVESILYGSPMHDIGKIGIPDSILMKPGKLDNSEWAIMKQHTIIGASILEGADSEIVKVGSKIAISHHEKWNGTGYPFNLKGEEIPLPGRITALADVFDSLTSKRVYRKEFFSPSEAMNVIQQSVGRQFDPAVFVAFKAGWQDILSERERFRNMEESCNCDTENDTPLSEHPDFQPLFSGLSGIYRSELNNLVGRLK